MFSLANQFSAYALATVSSVALSLYCAPTSFAQSPPTAGGMSDITVLSVDIGHFDYGHKIIHVYENSRNQSENRNSPEKWQFVIEPLLSTRDGTAGGLEFKTFALDPVIEVVDRREHKRPRHRVMVSMDAINDWAREQALNVALAVYPDARCKIGRSNVDVLPLTELTLSISDIETKGGLMSRNAVIHSKSQKFMTSPKSFYLSFDVLENRDGGDEVLKRFISFIPFMQIEAAASFSVKSTRFNITSITAEKIKSSDLYVKLNGAGGVGYVTRDDLRKLALSAANQLSATSIVEDPASFSQELFNNILAQSQTVTADDAFFDDQRTKATFHGDDLKPDVVTREINKIFTKETGKDEWHFNGSMSGNVNVIDLFGGGFTNTLSGSQLHEFLKEHNVESDIQGNKIIAKSIQLQQVNIADFVSKFNFVGEFRNISGSAKNNLKTVIFGEPVVPGAISGPATFSAISAPCGNATALVVKQLVQ